MQIVVECASLGFRDRALLQDFSSTFESERVTALVGPSGSGKSTLLGAMAGYAPLSSGAIWFEHLGGVRTPPNPALVAWVPQGSNALGTRTALDNVAIAPLSEGYSIHDSHAIARDKLDMMGLSAQADQLARSLSGGELQRMSFARALASTKPLIFADEPSSSLDAMNTQLLAGLLQGLQVRATVVVATHDPILMEAASSIVDLRPGSTHAAR